jgi:hypothetical protein
MKKVLSLTLVTLCISYFGYSQEVKFTKEDQEKIQKVLGKEYKAVLGREGQLAVVTPKYVSEIKSTSRGGFTKLPGSAANAVFAAYEKAWIYKQSTRDILQSKLGQERFAQLKTIMQSKGLTME